MVEYPVRVLVVDDSAYMRKVIREMLEKSPFIEVIGLARDGADALTQAAELHPDVITVDLLMPGMDGPEFIRQQMARQPLPVVVCTSASDDSDLFLAAVDAGAVEFVQKPTALALDSVYKIGNEMVQAVLAAAQVTADKLPKPSTGPAGVESPEVGPSAQPPGKKRDSPVDAVLIGVSTGGPRALRELIPRFPRSLPVPVAVVLHIPPGYTSLMAQRLSELSQVPVVESRQGEVMKPGKVILAQAGFHTRLVRLPDGLVVTTLDAEPRDSLYCPAVDELFRSGTEAYQGRVLAVVMTGMGNDGTAGAGWIKAQGGLVFAEAEESSVVFGMPRSVIEAGLADRVVPLEKLADEILEVVA